MRVAHHRQQILDVNEPNRVIEILAAQRKTCVLGLDGLFHIGLEVVLEVKINDFTARRHDVPHDAVTEVEHVKDKFTPQGSNVRGFFALLEDQSQFLFAVCELTRGNCLKPEHSAQKKIRRLIEQPDGRLK